MRDRPFSIAAFRAAWSDPALRLADIAARFQVSRETVRGRARRLGLPPRRRGARASLPVDELRAMAALDMAHGAIADHFGCHWMTVLNARKRLGIPNRSSGRRSSMSAQEYRAMKEAGALDLALAASAQRDRLLVAMVQADVSRNEIARALGISAWTVTKRARRLGLPPRRSGGGRRLTLQDFTDLLRARAMAKSIRKAS